MKKIALIATFFGIAFFAKAQEEGCFVRCIIPNEYTTQEVKVLVKPAYKTLKITPAEYKTVEERVMVKEASKRYEFTPAQYKTETVSYTSEEGHNKLSIVPASFSPSSEKIEVAPAGGRYETTTYAGCESSNPMDCQGFCYKKYDAEFTTIATQVLAADASTTSSPVPGKTKTYTKQVLVKDAEIKTIEIPAEYKTITKRVLVKDEGVEETTVPAEYTTVTKQVLVKAGGIGEDKRVDCALLDVNVLPINYPLGSASLTPQAKKIIDTKLYKLMKETPGVRVEISAHTDSRGSKASNQALSERRAQAVVNYLVSKGISRSRLVARGYGESKLKNKCADGVTCTEAEHAVNRRTEFRVLRN